MPRETLRLHLQTAMLYTERSGPLQVLSVIASSQRRKGNSALIDPRVQQTSEELGRQLLAKLPEEVTGIRLNSLGTTAVLFRDGTTDPDDPGVRELWQIEQEYVLPLAKEMNVMHVTAFPKSEEG